MNLINFHTYEKNKKYIYENKCQIIGQGLIASWDILVVGNGFNKYIFKIMYNGKEYNVYIDENHIREWRIRTKFEEEKDEIDSVEFSAYCNFNNMGYYEVESWDHDDFDHIYINGENRHKLKIIDITITNEKFDAPLICDIYHDYKRIDHYKDRISDISNYKCTEDNLENLEIMEYKSFVRDYISGQKYYLYSDHGDIVPFDVIQLEEVDEEECHFLANIYEKECSFKTIIKMRAYICVEDGFPLSIEFKVISEVFGDVYWNFDCDCQLKSSSKISLKF